MTAAIDISAAARAAAARPLSGGAGDYDGLMNLVGDARFVEEFDKSGYIESRYGKKK